MEIYTEPEEIDLEALGPLAALAGTWEGQGVDTQNFRTLEYGITVTVEGPDAIAYERDTILQIAGRPEPFHHVDRSRLRRVAPPVRNPAALEPA